MIIIIIMEEPGGLGELIDGERLLKCDLTCEHRSLNGGDSMLVMRTE
jgi:hypothetical protein